LNGSKQGELQSSYRLADYLDGPLHELGPSLPYDAGHGGRANYWESTHQAASSASSAKVTVKRKGERPADACRSPFALDSRVRPMRMGC
jgi:hypothetical protein